MPPLAVMSLRLGHLRSGIPRLHLVQLRPQQPPAEPLETAVSPEEIHLWRPAVVPRPRRVGQQRAHLERGLVRRADQHHVAPDHIADGPGQERVVGAAQQQRVHLGVPDGASSRSASTCTWSEAVSPRSTNSTKPGQAAQVSSTRSPVEARERPLVGARPDGADRADHAHPSGRGGPQRGPQPGLDHPDERDVVSRSEAGRGPRRRRCCRPPRPS